MAKVGAVFLLTGNGPYSNRGCEGITRGTVEIIRSVFDSPRFLSVEYGSDLQLDEADPAISHYSIRISRFSQAWFVQHALTALGLKRTWFPVMGQFVEEVEAVLALGGDNYSMDYGSLRVHLALVDYVLARAKPLLIWGASVGPFDKRGSQYEAHVLKKLRQVNAILARESATVEYLAKHGLADNVRRVADPAFVMAPSPPQTEVPTPEGAIGINFSPLMARYISRGDLKACEDLVYDLVELLVRKLGRPIQLISHVFNARSNDYALLERVERRMERKGYPIHLLPPGLSAPEIKWVIGKLACFAGARTHSTIAAMASGIPTLSFAYSVKACGINRDVFDHEEYLLLPGQMLPDAILDRITHLLDEEASIREHLHQRIPEIKELAYQAGTYLKGLVETGDLL